MLFSPLIQCHYQLNYFWRFNQVILSTVAVALIVIRLFSADNDPVWLIHHFAVGTDYFHFNDLGVTRKSNLFFFVSFNPGRQRESTMTSVKHFARYQDLLIKEQNKTELNKTKQNDNKQKDSAYFFMVAIDNIISSLLKSRIFSTHYAYER